LSEPLMWLIHYQITFATIERPSRTSPGAPSLVDTLHSTNSPRPILHQPTQWSCVAKWFRCVPVDEGSRVTVDVGEAHAPSELVRTEADAAAGRYRTASIRG
jgi:hypothetical protein